MPKTITVRADVYLPAVPSHLRYDGGSIDVAEISDDDLRQLGTAWVEELLQTAQRRRATPAGGAHAG